MAKILPFISKKKNPVCDETGFIEPLFCFLVCGVNLAVLAVLVHLQTHLQLWVAGGVVVVFAAGGALEANHGFLWHRGK